MPQISCLPYLPPTKKIHQWSSVVDFQVPAGFDGLILHLCIRCLCTSAEHVWFIGLVTSVIFSHATNCSRLHLQSSLTLLVGLWVLLNCLQIIDQPELFQDFFLASVDNCNMNNLEATNVLCNTWMVYINKPFRIEDWLIIGSLPQKKQTWQQLLQHHRPFSVSTQQRSNKTLKPATGMSYPSGPLHTKWRYMKTNWDSCYPWKLSIHPSISVECDAGGEAQKSISHNPPSTSIS